MCVERRGTHGLTTTVRPEIAVGLDSMYSTTVHGILFENTCYHVHYILAYIRGDHEGRDDQRKDGVD